MLFFTVFFCIDRPKWSSLPYLSFTTSVSFGLLSHGGLRINEDSGLFRVRVKQELADCVSGRDREQEWEPVRVWSWTRCETFRESVMDQRPELIFPHFLLLLSCVGAGALWMVLLPGLLPEASQEQKWGVQPAEHSRSSSKSQALVIMLWMINAAETQRAAAQLSDSGPSWSCTHILNIYSPVQLCLFWKSTKHVQAQRL